jgi:catechol 2,3-dioxygenase-like lactoylglutathione lyase family enzyme
MLETKANEAGDLGTRTLLGNARICADVPTANLERARRFYEETLGLKVARSDERGVFYQAGSGTMLNLFERPHTPSDQAVATFLVDTIETLMFALRSRGVTFVDYDEPGLKTEDGMFDDGQGFKTSWFKDPDGNLLSLEQLQGD